MIDIKSCQVLLHTSLYPEPCAEKAYFDDVCSSGQFWSLINSGIKTPYNLENEDEKAKLKEECFQKIFFTSRDHLYTNSGVVRVFTKHFAYLHRLMLEEKKRLRKIGKQMACKMQALESSIVIHDTIARLQHQYPDNIFLTIHDCIACEDYMADTVKHVLSEAVFASIGVYPALNVKPMNTNIAKTVDPSTMGITSLPALQESTTSETDWYFEEVVSHDGHSDIK